MLGQNDFIEYLNRYNITLEVEGIPNIQERLNFTKLINRHNSYLVSKEGIDLLERIFIYDHVICYIYMLEIKNKCK